MVAKKRVKERGAGRRERSKGFAGGEGFAKEGGLVERLSAEKLEGGVRQAFEAVREQVIRETVLGMLGGGKGVEGAGARTGEGLRDVDVGSDEARAF